MLAAMASKPEGRAVAWDFIRTDWRAVEERFGKSPILAASIMKGIAGGLSTTDRLEEVEAFLLDKSSGGTKRAAVQILEQIQLNIKQVRAHLLAFNIPQIDESADLTSWSRFSSIFSR
jgi:hypothetical protein